MDCLTQGSLSAEKAEKADISGTTRVMVSVEPVSKLPIASPAIITQFIIGLQSFRLERKVFYCLSFPVACMTPCQVSAKYHDF